MVRFCMTEWKLCLEQTIRILFRRPTYWKNEVLHVINIPLGLYVIIYKIQLTGSLKFKKKMS